MGEECRNCKKWQEDMYWNHFQCVAFCQFLSPGFEQQLALPKKFANNMRTKLPENVILKGPSGAEWNVGVFPIGDTLLFRNGWDTFVVDNSLKEEDVVIFKYNGDQRFDVLIFDGGSLCEREVSYFVRKCAHMEPGGGCIEEGNLRESSVVVHNHSTDVAPDSIMSKRPRKDNNVTPGNIREGINQTGLNPATQSLRKRKQSTPAAKQKTKERSVVVRSHSIDVAPESIVSKRPRKDNSVTPGNIREGINQIGLNRATQSLRKRKQSTPAAKQTTKESSVVVCNPSLDASPICTVSEKPKKDDNLTPGNSVSNGQPNGKILEESNETGSQSARRSLRVRKPTARGVIGKTTIDATYNVLFVSHRRPVTEEEKEKAKEMALAAATKDSFFVVMRASHVYKGFYMSIPSEWAVTYLARKSQQVTLRVKENSSVKEKTWHAKFKYKVHGGGLSGGWKNFAFDNNLEESDVCVFEIASDANNEIVLDVRIFRVVDEVAPLTRATPSPGPKKL